MSAVEIVEHVVRELVDDVIDDVRAPDALNKRIATDANAATSTAYVFKDDGRPNCSVGAATAYWEPNTLTVALQGL